MPFCPPGQSIPIPDVIYSSVVEVLCDIDRNVCVEAVKLIVEGTDQVDSISFYELDGTPLLVVPDNLGPCNDHWNTIELCSVALGVPTPVVVHYHIGCGGTIIAGDTFATFIDGTPFPGLLSSLEPCAVNADEFNELAICDIDPLTGDVIEVYLVRSVFDPDTGTVITTFINLSTGLPYVPVGVARFCGNGLEVEQSLICVDNILDINPPFRAILHTQYLGGTIIASFVTDISSSIVPLAGWGLTLVYSSECTDDDTQADTQCYVATTATADYNVGDILHLNTVVTLGNVNAPLFMQWVNTQTLTVFYQQDYDGVITGTFPSLATITSCDTEQIAVDTELFCAEILDPLLGYAVPVTIQARYITLFGQTSVSYIRLDTNAIVSQPLARCGEYDLNSIPVCYLEDITGIAKRGLNWFQSRNGVVVSSYVTDLSGATVTGTIVPCGRRCRAC